MPPKVPPPRLWMALAHDGARQGRDQALRDLLLAQADPEQYLAASRMAAATQAAFVAMEDILMIWIRHYMSADTISNAATGTDGNAADLLTNARTEEVVVDVSRSASTPTDRVNASREYPLGAVVFPSLLPW